MADCANGSFAARLRHLFDTRRKPGTGKPYTPDEVAKGTGLSTSYVNYLLNGERDNPTRSAIQQLANFFRVQPNYFFESVAPDVVSANVEVEADPDLETITVLARRMPAGPSRASLRAIVEQVAALEAQSKAPGRRNQPE
ncbi:helix-turn-helix transcriptional regulator [Verrucosispora sp. FIM060022]|uniref:helix-turn-helix domain-containing protein n=1 Tax=Verrucosispora sp. FIM060022 TaxID=1479020 RepID=UPI000F8871C0|nr:helix-turn-helix transcriptional regulator [Verrucosispora sp. FIM060022]RUL95098.1 XRE family transcriptional regulator [Verrucosispora sp. FIM060022]